MERCDGAVALSSATILTPLLVRRELPRSYSDTRPLGGTFTGCVPRTAAADEFSERCLTTMRGRRHATGQSSISELSQSS